MKYDCITRESLHDLVHQFYAAVRLDDKIGPVFIRILGDDWSEHLEKLVEFWSTMVLGTRNFKGNVYGKHMRLSEIDPDHFRRWLSLFETTMHRLFDEACAKRLMVVAHRVAGSLQLGFFGKVEVH